MGAQKKVLMKLRVYLDTSVFSAYYDERVPKRRERTVEFWERRSDFELSTSELAGVELEQRPDEEVRSRLSEMLSYAKIIEFIPEVTDLARRYITAGVFSCATYYDALHVAAAVISRQDISVSLNFRHLVNRQRRAKVNSVNVSNGLPAIEILAPPEPWENSDAVL